VSPAGFLANVLDASNTCFVHKASTRTPASCQTLLRVFQSVLVGRNCLTNRRVVELCYSIVD
jgi:hypothetical protein